MSTIVAGLFTDSDAAGNAIAKLKEKGYTDEISVITRGDDGDLETEQVKEDVAEGALEGAGIGAVLGAIVGVTAVALPGAPLLIGGPVLATWGISGAALGALSGGLVGGLVDLGFDEQVAEVYKKHILQGDVMVAVSGDEDRAAQIMSIMERHNVLELQHLVDED